MVKLQYPKIIFEIKSLNIHKGGVGVFAVEKIKKGEELSFDYGLPGTYPRIKLKNDHSKSKYLHPCIELFAVYRGDSA